jgi:hypothetical protein
MLITIMARILLEECQMHFDLGFQILAFSRWQSAITGAAGLLSPLRFQWFSSHLAWRIKTGLLWEGRSIEIAIGKVDYNPGLEFCTQVIWGLCEIVAMKFG